MLLFWHISMLLGPEMLAYHEHYTLKDYELWEGDWELVNGSPYAMSPAPNISHQVIAGNILTQLNNAIKNELNGRPDCHALMEVDWEVSHDTVVRPDVLIVCGEIDEKIVRTPSVIFEVSSPSTAKRDELLKFELYEKEGVSFYILVYPVKNIAKVYKWVNGSYQKRGDFSTEEFSFDLDKCKVMFDFSSIWRR